MVDANKDIWSGPLRDSLMDKSIRDAITQRHRGSVPQTYNKGRYPIDETFLSPTLQISQNEYLSFG